jgi:aspartyl-tRNA(Asn)/glutamyl-tRNA(Gln) amidotransferase subunit A
MCFVALDTDAIGSCRLPAAVCGVVGFKGTYGLISMEGILADTEPPDEMIRLFSCAGVTARSAEDAALVLEALTKKGTYEKAAGMKLRVAVAENLEADDEVMAAFEKAVENIRDLGHDMSEVSAPLWNFDQGIASIVADRKSIAKKVFNDIDVIILPTIPTTTPLVKAAGENPRALSAAYTVFANYYGLPAASVPCGFDKRGLPLGLQIVGKPGDDAVVLRLAGEYHATQDTEKHPR